MMTQKCDPFFITATSGTGYELTICVIWSLTSTPTWCWWNQKTGWWIIWNQSSSFLSVKSFSTKNISSKDPRCWSPAEACSVKLQHQIIHDVMNSEKDWTW